MKGADEFESDAAKADAWHHRSDAITSAAALIGVSIAVWGPKWFGIQSLVLADEAAAILASGVILITASHLIRPALGELLDASSPNSVREWSMWRQGSTAYDSSRKYSSERAAPVITSTCICRSTRNSPFVSHMPLPEKSKRLCASNCRI